MHTNQDIVAVSINRKQSQQRKDSQALHRGIRITWRPHTIREVNRTDGDARTSSVAGGNKGCEGDEEKEGVNGHDIC